MVISVECSRCGKDLHFCMREWNSTIEVDPCESCVEEAEKAEYNNGFADGRDVGYDEGVASVET